MESRSETKRLALQGAKLYTQAEVDAAVAGAYLDAANKANTSEIIDSDIIADMIRRGTPADAKAALERRDAERDAKFNTICREHNQAELDETRVDLQAAQATIERLQAELFKLRGDHESVLGALCRLCTGNRVILEAMGAIEGRPAAMNPGEEWIAKKMPEYCGKHGERIVGYLNGIPMCRRCTERLRQGGSQP